MQFFNINCKMHPIGTQTYFHIYLIRIKSDIDHYVSTKVQNYYQWVVNKYKKIT